jgi:hypothetical protein
MTTTWQYYTRNLSAETLKCKRTKVLWLAVGAPLFITFISFNVYYFNGHSLIKPGEDPWLRLLNNYRQIWPVIFFPLTISLQSALYPAIEHQSNTWKHVYSLAVPRWSVYAGKLTLFTALVALSMAMLFVFTEGVGALLGLLRPALGFDRDTAHATIARECSKLFLSALGMTAIQFYVGFRFRHFVLPVGFGLLMTVAAIALGPWEHITKFPYAWPTLTWPRTHSGPAFVPAFFTQEIALSLLVFAVVALLGCFETTRRDVE